MEGREQLLKNVERYGPYFGGLSVIVAGAVAFSKFQDWFALTGMSGKDAASGVFNVLVTITAFLFSVFVIAIAPGGGFIERIFRTKTFAIFRRYVIESLVAGAIATLFSIPFTSTSIDKGVWTSETAQVVWIAVATTALLSFARVMHIFLHWIGYDARQRAATRFR